VIKISKLLQLKNKDKKGNVKDVGKIEIKNLTPQSADLYFYGDIVSSEWEKWTDADTCPEDVLSFLKEVEGVSSLNIYINSGGGSVFAGMAIYNILKRNSAYKTVYVDGVAASIASIIAFAGDKLVVPSNAYVMIHKAWTITWGNANELRKMADSLDVIDEGILNVYNANLKEGASIEEIKSMLDSGADTWLTGLKAAEYFNIEVSEENKAAACASDYYSQYSHLPKDLVKEDFKSKEEPKQPEPVTNNDDQEKINLIKSAIENNDYLKKYAQNEGRK